MSSAKRPDRHLIGLTGNIATGKSAVMAMLRRLGARIINADEIAHQVMAPRTPVWEAIVQAFGEAILTPQGDIDRVALGRIVFRDPQALQRLEAIVHPAVLQAIEAMIEQAEEEVVVIEAIKLIEAGMHRNYSALWVVTCPPDQQVERLVIQRGLSEPEARLRIEAQPPQNDKVALADVVIDNSGTLNDLERQVVAEWHKLQSEISLGSHPK